MNHDCERARAAMVWIADGDPADAWVEMHLKACESCREALGKFLQIDWELIAWGKSLDRPAAAPPRPLIPQRFSIPWIPTAAVALATALLLILIVHYRQTAATQLTVLHESSKFRAIPYLAPLDPKENAEIVEMNIRVATLIAMGYRIAADPNDVVAAEVLLGEDGRAHAVRVLSEIDLIGPGD